MAFRSVNTILLYHPVFCIVTTYLKYDPVSVFSNIPYLILLISYLAISNDFKKCFHKYCFITLIFFLKQRFSSFSFSKFFELQFRACIVLVCADLVCAVDQCHADLGPAHAASQVPCARHRDLPPIPLPVPRRCCCLSCQSCEFTSS